jgi:spermidine/putrescine transport system permease protein
VSRFWNRYGADGLVWAAAVGVLAFLYFPMLVVVLYSFNREAVMAFPMSGYSLKWYQVMAQDRQLIDAVKNSLSVALLGTAIGIALGVPAAFALNRFQFPGKAVFERLVLMPLVLPGIVTGISLLNMVRLLKMNLSLTTVTLGHGTFLIAVVMTQVYAGLKRWDRTLEEAAADLYANEARMFWHVMLPNLKATLVGAGLLAFTLSMDEIAVSFFLIGRNNTLPLQIWSMLRRGITPEVNAISTVILGLSVLAIVLWIRLSKDEKEVS